ncbi:lytic transglycosylase domain-containing protein [Sphingomonas sp. AOB5]|uniref:lytic transglycosylase domain-containing protein n=1 Tax=Sphingomonas sp. AOB5 TaxID=3034017 RepID=UPI0023F6428A|nr:lytic transglycosylase domain-containing protein [Sphingomonas sp. AOB5]MDF7774476.1 lytic transglycosylase domain-containing protein [Sphingomonas sp. AOB5]
MLAPVIKSAALFVGVSTLAVSSQMTQGQIEWYRTAIESGIPNAAPSYIQSDQLAPALDEWRRLQQSDNWPFSDYANFLIAHPGWPGETSRRAAAETVLADGANSPGLTIRYFDRFPPLTSAGRLRFAEALLASGRRGEAEDQARQAWRKGSMRPVDETALLARFPGVLTADDHDVRADLLIWNGSTTAASRLLGMVPQGKRALYDARIAFRLNAPDAAEKAALVDPAGRSDAGYIADRASWLRANNQGMAARSYLGQPRRLSARPANVEKWYEVLLTAARGAQADGQYDLAYRIASQVDDAYPAGTDVSDRPYGERDDYTSLTWLAGTVAFYNLNRPADAVGMFDRYGHGSKTPQTNSKGLYWAGRAAEAAGQTAVANGFYQKAGGFPDLYYGQLSLERTGQPLKAPPSFVGRVSDPAVRDAFYKRETVRAAQLLGTLNRYDEQGMFIRQIAADATSDTDHLLAAELSRSIGRPDLGVMVGRSALQNGFSDYTAAGYPSVRVPDAHQDYWTIIHAIARQESQFDRAAISHAGARGLMQLMPGTARETAGKIGLGYNRDALTVDTDYNIQLGSTYFKQMYRQYGSYPLAVAAYNAGPGNVNKWIRANGDPRLPGADMVRWVELIPIFETKNYVQRVLENAVVYDLMNPQRARSQGPNNLSWYLGKNQPG